MKGEMKKLIKDTPDPWGIHLLGGKKAFDEWTENLPKDTKEYLKKKGVLTPSTKVSPSKLKPKKDLEERARVLNDPVTRGLPTENVVVWFYYLTDSQFTGDESMYSNIDARLYKLGINKDDANVFIIKKDIYREVCARIQEKFDISKIPSLIITKEKIGIQRGVRVKIKSQGESHCKLERGFFVNELCEDIDKINRLFYEIYEGAKKGEPFSSVKKSIKRKTYLGKVWDEAKDFISVG